MPSSSGLASYFGNWSGPGYSGGTTTVDSTKFVGLYNTVKPIGFLDNAAREHDAVYEYAERVYGKTPPSAEMQAMKNAVQFVADMDCRRAFKTTQVCALNFTQGL